MPCMERRARVAGSISVMDLRSHVMTPRQWLADALRDDAAASSPWDGDIGPLLDAAQLEGVVALVADRLRRMPAGDPVRDAFQQASRAAAIQGLLRDTECRRALALLEADGLPALLLKGTAVAWWLYAEPYLRTRADVDLLFASPAQTERAARVLRQHGFSGGFHFGEPAHEVTMRTRVAGSQPLEFDLHWSLFNAPLFAGVFPFEELLADSIPLPGLAPTARGLSPPHAFIHACIHRAKNLHFGPGDRLKWLYDLHLMARCMSGAEWERVLLLCRRHGVGGICLEGLQKAQDSFGDGAPAAVIAALAQAGTGERIDVRRLADWRYMQWMNFKALPTYAARLRWVWQRLFPPTGYLREIYGEADAGRGALLLERVRRLGQRLE